MPTPRDTLIVFSRWPLPGHVKTRLIPALGAQGAADLHRQLIDDTLARARALARQRPVAIEVWCADGDEQRFAGRYGGDWAYRRQSGADLGARMLHAFEHTLTPGRDRSVLIGSDCPDLSPAGMQAAFERLSQSDLVLGPARDGGYYLIGLRRPIAQLFRDVAWGTGSVRAQTLAVARQLRLTVRELPLLDDIDRPEDLARLGPRFDVAPRTGRAGA